MRYPVTRQFGHQMNDDHFPNWILPGSEAIMPKKSAPLNLWDDERDVKTGIIHNKAIYDPSRELYLQSESDIRLQLQSTLRSYLKTEGPPLDPNPQGQAHWTSNDAHF